ncbi:antimicrobial peptide NK-lysin-like isoform X2 [Canis aureus]
MTSWALLLLASVLLATPGLTYSDLIPEDHDDLSTADICQEEQFFRRLAQEAAQVPQFNGCDICRMIMTWLRTCVGTSQIQEAIRKATKAVCSNFPAVEKVCKDILIRFLYSVAQFFLNSDPSRDICVTFRLCRHQVGDQGAGTLLHPGEKHRVSSRHRQLLPS